MTPEELYREQQWALRMMGTVVRSTDPEEVALAREEAERSLVRIATENPDNEDALQMVADTRAAMSRWESGRAEVDRATALWSGTSVLLWSLAGLVAAGSIFYGAVLAV